MFERLKKWLRGEFTCVNCNKLFHLGTFGYGETICPDCYDAEIDFIFYDDNFILNRFMEWISRK